MRVDDCDAGIVTETSPETVGFDFAEKDGDVRGDCVSVPFGDRLGVLDAERDVDCVRVTDTDAVDDEERTVDDEANGVAVALTEAESTARVGDGTSDVDGPAEVEARGEAVRAATVCETDGVTRDVRDGAPTV